jgi:hypothetical protein
LRTRVINKEVIKNTRIRFEAKLFGIKAEVKGVFCFCPLLVEEGHLVPIAIGAGGVVFALM